MYQIKSYITYRALKSRVLHLYNRGIFQNELKHPKQYSIRLFKGQLDTCDVRFSLTCAG